jgi:hypothetical protein
MVNTDRRFRGAYCLHWSVSTLVSIYIGQYLHRSVSTSQYLHLPVYTSVSIYIGQYLHRSVSTSQYLHRSVYISASIYIGHYLHRPVSTSVSIYIGQYLHRPLSTSQYLRPTRQPSTSSSPSESGSVKSVEFRTKRFILLDRVAMQTVSFLPLLYPARQSDPCDQM